MMKQQKYILAIESSCDDTSAAVIYGNKILSNVIANQKIHEKYGGVIPELASREHQKNIIPTIDIALKEANIELNELKAIAVTTGPGLLGSLLVGTSVAKSMALSLSIPIIEVNHMQAHIMAHFIEDANPTPPQFPFICLTVSGGHTQLLQINNYFDIELLGETLDDAAGEAFDKSAKLLGLPYPGGPLIDKYAKEGDILFKSYTKPKTQNELDFSFSGLKTNIMQDLKKELHKDPDFTQKNLSDLCASIQHTIVEILLEKMKKAAEKTGITNLAIAGGVSANSYLRKKLVELGDKNSYSIFIPKFSYTTDNAAMIAQMAELKYQKQDFSEVNFKAKSRLSVTQK